MSHYLLKNFSENVDAEYPQKIFELGIIFSAKEKGVQEEERLCTAISPGNFTEVKQALEYFFKMFGGKAEITEPREIPTHFIEGRTAEIIFNEEKIGYAGEIHPKILRNWKIKMPVALLEINLDKLLENLKD